MLPYIFPHDRLHLPTELKLRPVLEMPILHDLSARSGPLWSPVDSGGVLSCVSARLFVQYPIIPTMFMFRNFFSRPRCSVFGEWVGSGRPL